MLSARRLLRCLLILGMSVMTGCGVGNFAAMHRSTTVLTVSPIVDRAFSIAPIAIAAKSSSPAPIAFAVLSGPATFSGPTLTLTGTGVVTIQVSQSAVDNCSPASVEESFTVTKASPALVVQAIPTQIFGGSPIRILAGSNSAAPLTYAVAYGPASITGPQITLLGAGSVMVTVEQAATSEYSAATATIAFEVSPANPNLQIKPISSFSFGAAPVGIDATSSSPAPMVYSIVSGSGIFSGNVLTVDGAGTVVLTVAQPATANYLASSQTVTVSVTQGSPDLSFNPILKVHFGSGSFEVSTITKSLVPVVYSVASGPATIQGTEVTVTGAGTVVLSASQAESANYLAQQATTTFVVGSGTPNLEIAAISQQAYGAAPISIQAHSDSPAAITYAVSGPASLQGSSVSMTAVGTITITASQGTSPNYIGANVSTSFLVVQGSSGLRINSIPAQTYGSKPITLSSTSQATSPVLYSVVSGPAMLTGSLLTTTGTGPVIVAASQSGDPNYADQIVTSSLTVSAGDPGLVIAPITSHILGDAPFLTVATSKSTGAFTYSIQSGPATLQGNVITLTDVGLVAVSASVAADSNYSAETVSTNFTVSKDVVVISPAQAVVTLSGSLTFAETQSSSVAASGTWVVLGGDGNGTIDSHGTYWAPQVLPTQSLVTVGYVVGETMTTASVQLQQSPPAITALTPSSLTNLSTSVTVTGSNFATGVQVLVNGNAVQTVLVDTAHVTFTAVLPSAVTTTLAISAVNPGSNGAVSNIFPLIATFGSVIATPSAVPLGNFQLVLSGVPFTTASAICLNGVKLPSSLNPDGTALVWGYLAPWTTGSLTFTFSDLNTQAALGQITMPVQSRAVPYDTASRFATQAAFGPNPNVVEHIQTVGLSAFIDEQLNTPGIDYSVRTRETMMENALQGTSLLRERVGWAFQSFIVSQALDGPLDEVPYVGLIEADAFGNFRQMLGDITADASLGRFLNLAGNAASSDPTVRPNQNFARELLQLFSVGTFLLNDDGTTQTDLTGSPIPTYDTGTVIDLSRALTGWEFAQPVNPLFTEAGLDFSQPLVPIESEHDAGSKMLFGSVAIPSGQTAAQDRANVLDAIFAHPNVPPYISRLLIQHLVKSAPSPDYVRRIAGIFKDDGTGVRGNLAAVIKAILLDPEARAGDTGTVMSDGFIQEPLLFQLFAMNAIGAVFGDDEGTFIPGELGEEIWRAPTVFGFYDPAYRIPGTTINSPEFMLLNNVSIMQRNAILWGMIEGYEGGFGSDGQSWLYTHFTSAPQMADALNHLLYHGQMPQYEQDQITQYWGKSTQLSQLEQQHRATFFALSADSYTVAQ